MAPGVAIRLAGLGSVRRIVLAQHAGFVTWLSLRSRPAATGVGHFLIEYQEREKVSDRIWRLRRNDVSARERIF